MSKYLRKANRVFAAVIAAVIMVLLVSVAAAYAQHKDLFAKVAGPIKMVATTGHLSAPKEVKSDRPIVKILLAGAIERNSNRIPIEKAGPVSAGEVVSFTINSVNEGTAPASEYRAIGQIPQGTTFVPDSAATANTAQITYSIDSGRSFSPKPIIEEKQADGTIKKISAPVSMYTQIRFEWADPLVAGGKLAASYQVCVK